MCVKDRERILSQWEALAEDKVAERRETERWDCVWCVDTGSTLSLSLIRSLSLSHSANTQLPRHPFLISLSNNGLPFKANQTRL